MCPCPSNTNQCRDTFVFKLSAMRFTALAVDTPPFLIDKCNKRLLWLKLWASSTQVSSSKRMCEMCNDLEETHKKQTRNRKQETNNISNQRVVVHCETLSVPENGFWGETIVVTIVHGFQQLHRHRCTMQPQQPGWRGWFIVVFGFQRVFKQSLHVVHPVENNNKTNDHKRKANNNNKTRRCVQCTGGVVASIRRMCVATFFTHSSHILHTFFTHSSHILHTFFTHSSHIIHSPHTFQSHPVCIVWFVLAPHTTCSVVFDCATALH
jgi:hypothetical protein